MLTIIVSPAGRGKFTAHLQDGRQLCQRTFSPLAAARQLLADGRDPATQITMRHAGSSTDALVSTIGVAAKLCVTERQAAAPRLRALSIISRRRKRVRADYVGRTFLGRTAAEMVEGARNLRAHR